MINLIKFKLDYNKIFEEKIEKLCQTILNRTIKVSLLPKQDDQQPKSSHVIHTEKTPKTNTKKSKQHSDQLNQFADTLDAKPIDPTED